MKVSAKFPDVFLRYEHRTYKISVGNSWVDSKRFGRKYLLSLSYEWKWEGTGDVHTTYLDTKGQVVSHWADIWGIPAWSKSRREKFFTRPVIEEYEILKKAADINYEQLMTYKRQDAEDKARQRKTFDNLINEIGVTEE